MNTRRGLRRFMGVLALVLFERGVLHPARLAAAGPEEMTPVRAFRSFEKRASDGLPQSTVPALYQDSEGVLWIATLDGLATFDGSAIRPVPKLATAPGSGPVHALAGRRGGGVHAGTNAGVYSYDGAAWSLAPTRHPALSVAEAEDGALWIVDQSGDIWRKAARTGWEIQTLPKVGVGVAVSSRTGPLFVAGREGVVRITPDGVEPVAGRPPSPITALLPASSGACWIGTLAGELLFASPGEGRWIAPEHPTWDAGYIRSMAEDRRGRVWAGGKDGRIAFGREKGAWTDWSHRNGVKRSGVMALLADREGTMWLGFNGNGIQQWLGEAWSHRNLWGDEPDGYRTQVFGVTATHDGRGFFAAVFSLGIWHWDGTRMRRLGRAEGITEDVRCATEPEPGVIWVGARFGLFESRGGRPFTHALTLPTGFVTGIFRSPAGTWHAATSTAGVYRLGPDGWTADAALNGALPHLNVRDMAWRGDELLLATSRGLTIATASSVANLAPDPARGIPETPNCILVRGDGEVWIGGFGGIGIRTRTGARFLTAAEGLPGSTVYALAEAPDGSLWAGGSMGVGHLSGGKWTVYSARNGLLEDECNLHGLLATRDGGVLVGTMASLARFDPSIAAISPPPLRSFWREPKVDASGVIRLPPGTRELTLAWSAPWLAGDPVEYRTRMRPTAAAWSEPQRKGELVLEGLRAGRWNMEVQARLAGEAAWSAPISARIEIRPLAWETTWARVGAVVLLVLAVLGVVRARTRALGARAAWLDAEVARRTAELEASNRELEEAKRTLAELARRDPLTGLHNRRAADERLSEVVSDRRRFPSPFAILVFDIDQFKSINDRFGHETGDAVLKLVGELCATTVRGGDFVARYGGDEFLVIYMRGTHETACKAADRLRRELETRPVLLDGHPPLEVTLSGGIAAHTAGLELSAAALVAAADQALYQAKRGGRNRVELATLL